MRVSTHVYAEATHVMDLRRDRKRSLKLREVQDLQEYTKAQDAQERKQNHNEIEVQSRALAHFVCIHRGVCLFQRLLVFGVLQRKSIPGTKYTINK